MNPLPQKTFLKTLILEDSLFDLELMTEQLSDAGFQLEATHVELEADFEKAVQTDRFDIILSDYQLPGFNAFGALELCQKYCPEVPFICISGSIGEDLAIELLKKGAVDYVLKDRPGRLPFAIKRAMEEIEEKAGRLKAEKELIESENRFRQVAENAQEWIWEVDTHGMYTYSSPVIKTLLGYTPEEVVGKKCFYDFFVPEKREELEKAALDVFAKEEKFWNFENQNVHKNGSVMIFSTSGSPIFDDAGNLTGYRGVDEDITERKNAERALIELNQELENRVELKTAQLTEANKELEAFTYSVSHDLRAPLRAINAFAEILIEGNLESLNQEGQRACFIIRENAIKMNKLINDLLKLSKLSKKEMLFTDIDMNDLVDKAYEEVTTIDQRQNISFYRADLKNCKGDSSLITQVLVNLISNAVKYTGKTEKPVIEFNNHFSDTEVTYTIKDNGAGFDMKYVDRLFNLFQRLHTDKEFEGIGVGLAIVNRIIKKHEGKVGAKGSVGQGAEFSFSLPLVK